MNTSELLSLIDSNNIQFDQVMAYVEANYIFKPVAFTVGDQQNASGTNQGSCKIFALAKHLNLNETQTLQLFGDYYRVDVLEHPENTDHQNIRNFIQYGWQGVNIDRSALQES